MKRLLLLITVLLGFSVLGFGQSKSQIIVTLKDGQSIDRVNKDNKTTTAKHVDGTTTYLLNATDDYALSRLQKDLGILSVETNASINLADNEMGVFLLDDNEMAVFLLDKKAMLNGVQVPALYAQQPALSIIEADKARSISTGAATRIAIIDTGVDFNHPAIRPWLDAGADLVNRRSASEFDGLNLADSEQGVFLLDDGTGKKIAASAFGHGTLVAGVAHLVAPDATLVPIKAFDGAGRTSMFTIVQAVYQAIELKADVINMSFSTTRYSTALRDAVNKANAAGIAVVASMGNEGKYTDSVYPAAYSSVYGVAATDFKDRIASFSNFGKAAAISAPGMWLITTYPGGKYAAVAGTSFSAPLVSGTVSLLESLHNRGTSDGPLVVNSAESIDVKNPGFEKMLGKGRVNARLALEKR